ncbi:MAG: hypothetical protein MK089_11190 [Phycisphaerales bacterium]|nr:hypothetical protein [Phycisphaerales bacterium]
MLGKLLFGESASQSKRGYIWIGLDFGSATTECVVRHEQPGQPDDVMIMAFDGQDRTDAKLIIPSAVGLRSGTLVPGRCLKGGEDVHEHIKLSLIERAKLGLTHEHYDWDSEIAFCSLHLADVISCVRKSLKRRLGEAARKLPIRLAIAAPLSVEESDEESVLVERAFREMGWYALQLSETLGPGEIDSRIWRSVWSRLIREEVPAVDSSPVSIVPEALAAVSSYLLQPSRQPGLYATIDIGGGTTDLSFFWFNTGRYSDGGDQEAWYYSMETSPIGFGGLLGYVHDVLQGEAGHTSHQRLSQLSSLQPYLERDGVLEFLEEIHGTYVGAWKNAYRVDQNMKTWLDRSGSSTWTLLLLGGGAGWDTVQDHMKQNTPYELIQNHMAVESLEIDRATPVLLPSGKHAPEIDRDDYRWHDDRVHVHGHMLSVAHGLSHRAPDLPCYGQEDHKPPPSSPPCWVPPEHTVHN